MKVKVLHTLYVCIVIIFLRVCEYYYNCCFVVIVQRVKSQRVIMSDIESSLHQLVDISPSSPPSSPRVKPATPEWVSQLKIA